MCVLHQKVSQSNHGSGGRIPSKGPGGVPGPNVCRGWCSVAGLAPVMKSSCITHAGVVIGSHNTWQDEGTFSHYDGHFTSNGRSDKNTAG